MKFFEEVLTYVEHLCFRSHLELLRHFAWLKTGPKMGFGCMAIKIIRGTTEIKVCNFATFFKHVPHNFLNICLSSRSVVWKLFAFK
jgi:hypothetical protein